MRHVWVVAGWMGCASRGSGPTKLAIPDLLEQSLPGVVLLFGPTAKGTVGIGSGVLLEDDRVLTNLHVVEQNTELWAMVHDPSRESYTALDGGVARFVTEYGRSALPTRFVKGDAINDLAVLAVEGDTSGMPTLDFRPDAPRPGETVVALGHPLGNPWSFSKGVVSAVHRGAIQHDAAINVGNSGGPLIDLAGRVVGINTIKLVGGAEGIGYARPFEVVGPMLEAPEWSVLDLSSPEAAYRSTNRAMELGRAEVVDAFDWSFKERVRVATIERGAERAAAELGADPEAVRRLLDAHYTAEQLDAEREAFIRMVRGEVEDNAVLDMLETEFGDQIEAATLAELAAYMDAFQASQPEYEPAALEACGIKFVQHRPSAMLDMLKLGSVVEDVQPGRTADEAWLLTSGVNMDGTPWRCSAMYVRHGDRWLSASAPDTAALASLPADWPQPPYTLDRLVELNIGHLLLGLRFARDQQREGTPSPTP